MRAVDVERAEPGPELPVYQATVLAEPFVSDVADPSGVPLTRSGGCVAVIGEAVKPSEANAASVGGAPGDRQGRGVVGVDRDGAAVDRRRCRRARDLIDLGHQGLDAVVDVDGVARRRLAVAEGDGGAIDGDGVIIGEPIDQRVAWCCARQCCLASNRGRRRCSRLVIGDSAGSRAIRTEKIVTGFDGRRRHQRGIGQRADRRIER